MDEIRVIFLGDVYAKPGKDAVRLMTPILRQKFAPDIFIVNGENVAGGFGITQNLAQKIFRYGVDVITLGNHTWNKREDLGNALDIYEHLLRPANYPPGNPGHGWTVFTTQRGVKVGVVNLMGRVYMPTTDCPFRVGRAIIERLRQETKIIIVDFHAEATSEKIAMGYYFDGLVSAVVGTHTHVQTADEKILPQGTAYITDCGMTGPHDSVIGVKKHLAIEHLLKAVQVKFEPASGGTRVQGVFIKVNPDSGLATHIERIDMPVEIVDS